MNAPTVAPGSLFATDAPFVLWFRPSRRHKWEAVAHTETDQQAVNAIGIGGRHNGQWLVLPAGQEP